MFLRENISPGKKFRSLHPLGVTMGSAEIESKADAIAARGIKRVAMGDRSHTFFSPKDLRDDAAEKAADEIDDTYAGFIDVKMCNPS